jgi:hypothetical protein
MPALTPASLRYLRTLGPHTEKHARQLLQLHPLLQVSSARRAPSHNRRVGGAPNSFHLTGRAVDIVGPLHDLQAAARDAWRLRLGPRCTGPEEVLLERSGQPGQHLHVAW